MLRESDTIIVSGGAERERYNNCFWFSSKYPNAARQRRSRTPHIPKPAVGEVVDEGARKVCDAVRIGYAGGGHEEDVATRQLDDRL